MTARTKRRKPSQRVARSHQAELSALMELMELRYLEPQVTAALALGGWVAAAAILADAIGIEVTATLWSQELLQAHRAKAKRR